MKVKSPLKKAARLLFALVFQMIAFAPIAKATVLEESATLDLTPEQIESMTIQAPAWASENEANLQPGSPFFSDTVAMGDSYYPVSGAGPDASAFSGRKWTNGVVYYQFDSNVNTTNRSRFRDAAAQWSNVARVSFVEGTGAGNYIHVKSATGNWSYVGMIGGRQEMGIYNWTYKFIICHEIGHALGLSHEQSRSDRDNYVNILYENIESSAVHNFDKRSTTNYGPYDFESVMHYGNRAFLRAGASSSSYTIYPKPGYTSKLNLMGNRSRLSSLDKQGMADHYGGVSSAPDLQDYKKENHRLSLSGNKLTIEGDVANRGGSSAGSFRVSYYASTNTTITSGDHFLGSSTFTGLTNGYYRAIDKTVTLPNLPVGTYYIGWVLDSSYQVTETNEGNNAVYVSSPTLRISSPSSSPEIDIRFNSTSSTSGNRVPDGFTTTSSSYGTDFGTRDVGSWWYFRFRVYNTGSANLTVSASDDSSQFFVSELSSSVSAGSYDEFRVNFRPTSAGTKYVTITIANNDSDENPYTFRVRGVAGASNPPVIDLSTSTLSFSALSGQSQSRDFTVRNSGSGTLNYSISDSRSWLNVSPSYGSSTGETDRIRVTANASALSVGTHTGTITVSGTGASSKTIHVSFTVRSSGGSGGSGSGGRPGTPGTTTPAPNLTSTDPFKYGRETIYPSSGLVTRTVAGRERVEGEASVKFNYYRPGTFSGKIVHHGVKYTLRGVFTGGRFTGQATRRKSDPLTVSLETKVYPGSSAYGITGTIRTSAGATSQIRLRESWGYNHQANRYTFLIPADENGSSYEPAGDGYGAVTVKSKGRFKFSGRLGDGTRFTESGYVVKGGEFYLYRRLYGRRGLPGYIGGRLQFRNVANVSDFDGKLQWKKESNSRHRKYSYGFDLERTLVGSKYEAPSYRGDHVLGGLNYGDTTADMSLVAQGLSSSLAAITVNVDRNDRVSYSGADKLRMRFNKRTGLVSGRLYNGKRSIGGAVLQKQDLVAGIVNNKYNTGHFTMTP